MSEPPEMPKDMAGRWLLRWTQVLSGHRLMLSIVLAALGILGSVLSKQILWQPDVLLFFSSDSKEVQNVRELAERPGPANYLRIDVHEEGEGDSGSVSGAALELATALRATGKFRMVWTGVDSSSMASAYGQLIAQAPLLLTDADRAAVESHVSREFLRARFAEVRQRLIDPDGEILLQQLQSDPLDLGELVKNRMGSMSTSSGTQAAFSPDGVMMARDAHGGAHALILAEPVCTPTDISASELLLTATDDAIAALKAAHAHVGVWVVSAHRGYVENARLVRLDVARVSLVGSLAVAAAIAIYFRRISTALLCIIAPTLGTGLVLGISGAMQLKLPLLLLGFTALLCGSTTDYGIQIISECRRLWSRSGRGWTGELPAIAARRLLGPVTMSMTTSVAGYAALGWSNAPGLATLGLFIAAATICIWLITFLVLPAYLGPWILPRRDASGLRSESVIRMLRPVGFACFTVCTLWLGAAALKVDWVADLRALDGTSHVTGMEIEALSKVWGDTRNQAIVVVDGGSTDEAFKTLQRVQDFLSDQERDGLIAGISSAAGVLPDRETAGGRAAAWRSLWSVERRNQLREMLSNAAAENGFTADAFAAYAERVADISVAPAEERLKISPAALVPGLIAAGDGSRGGGVSLAAIVRMRPGPPSRQTTGWSQELRLRFPGIRVLSGNILVFDATDRARAEGERFAIPCLLVILWPLWLYLRRFRSAWLVMCCLIVGITWVLGSAAIFGGGLNVLAMVPVLFALGVTVDYGIYAATDPAWKSDTGSGNRQGATFMCALTTILGSGALVLASHPALYWIGITLVAGITGGYLASVFVVAPLTRRYYRSRAVTSEIRLQGTRIVRRILSWIPDIALAAVTVLLTGMAIVPIVSARRRPEAAGQKESPMVASQTERRTYVAGNSWMRWRDAGADSGLWEMAVTGEPFTRGEAMAALGTPIDMRIENEMFDQFSRFVPSPIARWMLLQGVSADFLSLPSYVPQEYQLEIYGQSRFAGDPHAYLAPAYPRILDYHALHDISQKLIDNPLIADGAVGCTGVITLPSYTAAEGAGHLMLGRNFDFEGGESFGRQKSITYVIPPAGQGIPFAHVAWPGLSGAVTGMNRQRIAVFINAAATADSRRIGTPTILMVRQILQYAGTLEEAERIIRGTQVFVSDIIVVADGKSGRVKVFEKSPAREESYEVDQSAVVTNHLVTPAFAGDRANQARKAEGTTMQRYTRARQLLDRLRHRVTVESLAALLRDKQGLDDAQIGYGNRNAIDGLIACHSVIMDVTAGQLWVAAWPNAEGRYIGVDAMAMLDHAAGNEKLAASASPEEIPADMILPSGLWQRIQEARGHEEETALALKRGEIESARKAAEMVVGLNPYYFGGHELTGRVLLKKGDLTGAKAEFARALELEPAYLARRNGLKELIRQCDNP